ncbi:MAG: recombinase family protein [Anaerolineae bacterium]
MEAEVQGRITSRLRAKIFLSGPAGSGKTTLALERLRWLVRQGMPATSILVLVPQRTLAVPYYDLLRSAGLGPAAAVDVVTLDGLARRLIQLFWPLIGGRAGFGRPAHPPVFLTVETAQYFMDGVAGPLIEERGYFDAVTIERTRLLSQLLDNLNKAALIGISLEEVVERLRQAWTGESARPAVYEQVGECIRRFRRYCLDHNLLDFSLQIETFLRHLWPQPAVRAYLFERYRHLIVDNVEEDTPVVHDLLAEWVAHCDSALIVYDQEGGYRIFLGADPASAARLAAACDERVELSHSHVASPDALHLAGQIGLSLGQKPPPFPGDLRRALTFQAHRFHPQMLDWAAGEIARLVGEGTPPGQIVALAPFVSDALRFSLLERLSARGIPARSHRPSRSLRDEPAARCLLTLARLAHPGWRLPPPPFDVTLALSQALDGLDLVRAHLLVDILYQPQPGDLGLRPFTQLRDEETRQRIGYLAGERYQALRGWLADYQVEYAGAEAPLDHFLSRLFSQVLSQPGFGFHLADQRPAQALEAGRVAADLIESARKFREVMEGAPGAVGSRQGAGEAGAAGGQDSIGARFVRMLERGVVAATYVQSWRAAGEDAVLIAPAYTYLMTNRPVDYQFWLDAGSSGWWERIYQPLTHPYVLRRDWEPGRAWTDEDEVRARQASLYRLVLGLARRCRRGIYLGISELGERGYEQQGPLLQAIQAALRRAT